MQTHLIATEPSSYRKAEASIATAPQFSVGLAANQTEIREAQKLRHQIFFEGKQAQNALAGGVDIDDFDKDCEHLIVRDLNTRQVVGCYRIMRPEKAAKRGGYYSDSEFNLEALNPIRSQIAEAGRACIHPAYRSGAVIMLLWSGLVQWMISNNYQYMIGCASIPLGGADDHAQAAAVYAQLQAKFLSPPHLRVTPKIALPLLPIEANDGNAPLVRIPPLLKGYTRLGAWICGAPAWDKAFNTADLFTMMSLSQMNQQYAKHFVKINPSTQKQ
jgi:putative hemolysin